MPTFAWTPGGGDGAGVFRLKIDDAQLDTGATEVLATDFTPASPLLEGVHVAYIQERDAAGNWSATGTTSVTVDLTPPLPPAVAFGPLPAADAVTVALVPSVDTDVDSHEVAVCQDAACSLNCTVPQATTQIALRLSITLVAGTSYYACGRAHDSVGHYSAYAHSSPLRFDTTAQPAAMDGQAGLVDVVAMDMDPMSRFLYVLGADAAVAVFSRNRNTNAFTHIASYTHDGSTMYLAGASDLKVSPEGRHVYVLSASDNRITQFTRNRTTETLTPQSVAALNANTAAANSMAFPVDGRDLYVASATGASLEVFARASDTGGLTSSQVLIDGVSGADALAGVRTITLSHDGRYLYTAAAGDSAVGVFRRTLSTGSLAFVDKQTNASLADVEALVVSADDRYLYAAGSTTGGITVFARAAGAGTLTQVGHYDDATAGLAGLGNLRSLGFDGSGSFLLAVGTTGGQGTLWAFRQDFSTGALVLRERLTQGQSGVTGLSDPRAMAASVDGELLFIGARGTDQVTPFALANPILDKPVLIGDFAPTSNPRTCRTDRSGRHRYCYLKTPSSGLFSYTVSDDKLSVQSLDSLVDCPTTVDTPAIANCFVEENIFLMMSLDRQNLYLNHKLHNGVSVLSVDPDSGHVSYVQSYFPGVTSGAGSYPLKPYTIAESPDGRFVYVPSSTDTDYITVFARNLDTGALSWVQDLSVPAASNHQTDSLMSVDGLQLYVTSYYTGYVYRFNRNPANGTLTNVDNIYTGAGDAFYLATDAEDYLAVTNDIGWVSIGRNTATGAISLAGNNPTIFCPWEPSSGLFFAEGSGTLVRYRFDREGKSTAAQATYTDGVDYAAGTLSSAGLSCVEYLGHGYYAGGNAKLFRAFRE